MARKRTPFGALGLSAHEFRSGRGIESSQSLLHGLDARLQHETGMPIVIAQNPLDCVAIGSGQSLEEFEALKGVLFSTNLAN